LHPEIVCGWSAHPALDKACHYFDVKLVKTDLVQETQEIDVAAVRRALTPNTVCVYATAGTFTHGAVDPIEELGRLCEERGVGLHVDNCLGGFYLSFLQKAGLFTRPFDFQVPGVTTISIDVHKYGFACKGVSVVAFRDNALRRATYHPVMINNARSGWE